MIRNIYIIMCRTLLLVLLLLCGGMSSVWGQTSLSGFWYLQNQKDTGHYLIPSGDKDSSNNPYVKTDKKQDLSAVWQLIQNNNDEYYIRHYSDGRYMIADDNTILVTTVALKEVDDLATYGNKALFVITENGSGSGKYNIMPKGANNTDGYNFLNPKGGVGKNIGLSLANDDASKWKMIAVPAKPSFSRTDNKVTITTTFGDAYYKLDNRDYSGDDATAPAEVDGSITGTKGKTVTLQYGPKYTVRAIAAYKNNTYDPKGWWTSEVTSSDYQINLIAPNLTVNGNTVAISSSQSGVKFKYSYEDGVNLKTAGTTYSSPITLDDGSRYVVRAIAFNEVDGKTYYSAQETSVIVNLRGTVTLNSLGDIDDATGNYVLSSSFTATGTPQNNIGSSGNPFKGTIDGGFQTISASGPLFECIENATIKNVILTGVSVSVSGNAGAIACEAKGASRIYNCGVLDGTVSGSAYTGGLVGLLDGEARVINCYSYANITGGTEVGGIVGHNNVATKSNNLKTMVMNCMFYGDITGGTNKAPIYNGQIITNRGDQSGVSNFNYFRAEASYVQNQEIDTYNCALMAETRFLQRFEFFRHLLNSHRGLAAWWVTGNYDNKDMMAKWVLEPSQIGTDHPYPILKVPGKYPSVVNIDAEHATTQAERNKGGKLGTLTVNIQMGNGAVYNHPGTGENEAKITTTSLTLNITDKDPDHFNFNYGKVQLPYYNGVGTKNYTGNRVVTGWKIVSITGGTQGSFTTDADVTYSASGEIATMPYNFADRHCTNKDLYSVSGRIFSQGAYWDVPEGVTAITIEPYWARCVYLADAYADVTYNQAMNTSYNVPNVGGGQKYTNGTSYSIAGENQVVYTSMGNAIASSGSALFSGGVDANNHTVYDYAVVLVGNYHFYGSLEASNSKPYTVTSIDLDGDNEPDYSYILRFDGRTETHPVRVDFINIPGLGMAQKSTGGTGTYNFGIMIPKGWFESTNTSLFRFTQFEYEHSSKKATDALILQGGVMEQWVSFSQKGVSHRIPYYHVGGNVWFKEFHRGCHQDKQQNTNHPPISVTGGDFDEFYLTGLYRADFANYDDNLECYINGGRFGIVAGAAQEGAGNASDHTNGNVVWQIQNADINEFYGGGLNAVHPLEGNITTVIEGGYIKQFCGGPKFGDMSPGKKVQTTATNCKFDTYYGAGYGGNSYSRFTPTNINNINGDYGSGNWNTFLNNNYIQDYRSTYGGVSVTFFTQYIPMSNNTQNVARLLIDFVSFSLATTHEVTSTLTGCTVTGNFYGGGSLGKVDGSITSILDGCTVNGNVFGAGYSASKPTVDVMNTGGFVKAPFYDGNLGVYLDPTFPETVSYRWEHRDETINSTERAIDKTNHILYTNLDLSTSNLGSVAGNVNLTIKGNSVIGSGGNTTTGNVYGGGDQSYVTGTGNKVTVNLEGNTIVNGNVFGGGNRGVVEGSTTVNIQE